MAVSSVGIGSGLNVEEIITGLMKIEKKPLELLQTKADGISAKISTYGQLTSAMASFQSAAVKLAGLGTWNSMNGTSGNSSAVSVSTGTGASAGSYSVEVQKLATAQSVSSKAFSSATSYVGSGTLKIDIGTWSSDNSTFTAGSGGTMSIDLSASDTLTTLRDKINALGKGVNASILTDGSGARLVINGRDTGAANGFRLTAVDSDGDNTDASGLSALGYDPQTSASQMTLRQSGANAEATINGLPVSSASNTLENVVEGVTLTLNTKTTSPAAISVTADTAKIKEALTGFVTAYNDLSKLLSTETKYNAETKTAGSLQGDSTAVSLQRQLRNMIGAATPASSVYQTLSSVGVTLQADGSLAVKDSDFDAALAKNLTEVRKLFTATDLQNNSRSGIATQLRKFSDSVLSVQGTLTSRTDGLNASLNRNDTEQTKMQTRIDATEAKLRAQYSALDTRMASLTSLNNYISQQIEQWNKA